jgi:hypothetical protein
VCGCGGVGVWGGRRQGAGERAEDREVSECVGVWVCGGRGESGGRGQERGRSVWVCGCGGVGRQEPGGRRQEAGEGEERCRMYDELPLKSILTHNAIRYILAA